MVRCTNALPRCVVVLLSLTLCLVNFGTVTSQTERAEIVIDANRTIGKISPLLYGQFLEHMFEGIKFGLHAELLRDRGFEEPPNAIGLSRYWERYPDDRNDDYAIKFEWDRKSSYPERRTPGLTPEHSLQVEAKSGVITRHGIFQPRVALKKGFEYVGSLWLKTTDYEGDLTVALEQDSSAGSIYSEFKLTPAKGSSWKKYEFRLPVKTTDPLARFVILFGGHGHIWLDQTSLMASDSVGSVRQDVLEKVKELQPAFLRWPGGNVAQDYHWQWAIGPRDERQGWTNLSWKNESEPADFGTAEYIQFSRNVGAEPTITVNVEGRGATAEEAAAWVEYCNGPTFSKYGALRAAHGYPEPFNVKFWEVGNEIWGSWVRGHSDAETYARNFNRYAAAMRKVDKEIKLIAVGDNNMEWNRTVVSKAGPQIDYLAVHHYYGRSEMAGDRNNLMARPLYYGRFYEQLSQLLRQLSPGRTISLAVNEWGLDLSLDQQYSMLSALYGARLMNVFERSNGVVAMSAVSDLVNGWPGGIIQASRDGLFVSPIYLVNKLYASTGAGNLIASEVRSPTFNSSKEGSGVSYLDVVTSRSNDGKHIFVKVVNTNLANSMQTNISVQGVSVEPRASLSVVNADSLSVSNSFATPAVVKITNVIVSASSSFQLTIPAHSVSVLTLTLK
ncbi:MAG TPA: alpha-L-arabinofuranosidase C-terminal domain-containing protein [Pyrinomonadaceae bacterium]|nr:alpha-L-arabinofuranosidase C-terminal domain-containing protein [Pyrinomonadaceae bacterium]